MVVSVLTETIDRWEPAVDADVLPNVANGEEQVDTARTELAPVDLDVPCRDVEEQHNKRAHRAVADHALAVGRYRRTAAEAHSVAAMHPRDDGHRHRP